MAGEKGQQHTLLDKPSSCGQARSLCTPRECQTITLVSVSSVLKAESVLPTNEPLITIPDAAERMGVVVTRLIQQVRDHKVIAVQKDGVKYLPEVFLNPEGELNRFVPGVIALLADGGYRDEEILRYLFTEDDTLPGRPVDALHGHLAREVMRRAQAMAF